MVYLLDVIKNEYIANQLWAQYKNISLNNINYVVRNNHLSIIKWLYKHGKKECITNIMDNVAEYGHLNIVKWLHENTVGECTTKAMEWAALNGHLHVIK